MRTFMLIILSVILLNGCYSTHDREEIPRPENLIEIEKMVELITEVELAESSLRQKQNIGHEINVVKEEYYTAIFKRYGVTKEQFDESMAYYKQDLETIDMIYEKVITRLSVMESEVQHE